MQNRSRVIGLSTILAFSLLVSCSNTPIAGTATAPSSARAVTAEPVTSAVTSPAATPTTDLTPAAPTLAPEGSYIKAIALNNFGPRLDTTQAREVIKRSIVPAGANYIALIPTCWTETYSDRNIVCSDKYEPRMIPPVSDEELIAAIRYAHSVGLRVFMKPQALVRQPQITQRYQTLGQGWSDTAWAQWFDSYTKFITHYAQIAEDNQVDLFLVGNEQDDTVHREADWRHVIAAVRAIYHGRLTYAQGAWAFDANLVKFWDALDYIGVQAYFGMVNKENPSIDDMKAAWQPLLQSMEGMSKRYGKPVLISEIGYRSAKNFNFAFLQGRGDFIHDPYDAQAQADYYEAFFQVLKDQPWVAGIVLWDVYTDPFASGTGDVAFTFIGKPAEAIVHKYFGGTPLTYAPPDTLVEDANNTSTVYADNILNGWKIEQNNPGATDLPYIYFKQPHTGKFSIRVPIYRGFELALARDTEFDMSKYTWLEFYIMVGKVPPKDLQLVVWSWYNEVHAEAAFSRRLPIEDPAYLAGGKFAPGTWQKVRIPLVDVGVTTEGVTEMDIGSCFFNCKPGNYVDDIYIDDIQLVGSKP